MTVEAAVLWGQHQPWTVEPVELVEPRAGEVLVRVAATGLCHSDDHAVTGDLPLPLPLVGGHEGAGIVEAVGPGVTRLREGDHVVLAFNTPCGLCHYCASGLSSLCAMAPRPASATAAPSSPISVRGQEAMASGGLGTFSQYSVVSDHSIIVIDDDIPLDAASLLGCAVTTGWGAAVYLGEVRPGDNVIVVGCGGVGVNSLQGARTAGADIVLAVESNDFKREQAAMFGATHAVATIAEARDLMAELTKGRMADVAILSVGVGSGSLLNDMLSVVGLNGRAVITSVTPISSTSLDMSLFDFTLKQKRLVGNVYGSVNVHRDIPLLLGLYRRGKLLLDELVTKTYSLADINIGYADMHAGKNLRGVVVHGPSSTEQAL